MAIVFVGVVVGLGVSGTSSIPDSVPDYALNSPPIYRVEIYLACLLAAWLTWIVWGVGQVAVTRIGPVSWEHQDQNALASERGLEDLQRQLDLDRHLLSLMERMQGLERALISVERALEEIDEVDDQPEPRPLAQDLQRLNARVERLEQGGRGGGPSERMRQRSG